MWFSKSKSDPAEVARGLREQVFSLPVHETGIVPGPGHTRVWSVLMEIGYPKAVASLVTIADGTTSLYFSNGGGIIGAGQHEAVSKAASTFIAVADGNVNAFAPTTDHPLPELGRVRFYLRTFDGLLSAEAGEEDLAKHRHRIWPLFVLGHAVISALREASPQP
jgi:hypothetical protein